MKEFVIELTNRCMNKCLHCSSIFQDTCNTTMDIDSHTLACAKQFAFNTDISSVIFSGGEPFLHPDFFSILKSFKETNKYIKVYTSGNFYRTMYDTLDFRQSLSLVDEFVVTCFSHDEVIHNGITGNSDSFANLNYFIDKIYSFGNKITMHIVPMRQNYTGIPFTIDHYHDKISFFSVLKLVKQGNASINWERIAVDNEPLSKILYECNKRNSVKTGNPFEALSNSSTSCGAGTCKVCLTFDRHFLPCEVFKRERKNFPLIADTQSLVINSRYFFDANPGSKIPVRCHSSQIKANLMQAGVIYDN